MTYGNDLTPRQRAFVAAMVTGMSQEEAAQNIGVKARQCRRYMATPKVRLALKEAQDAALGDVTRGLNAGSYGALAVLAAVMGDRTEPGGVRIRAAQVWLEMAFRARELLDFQERLATLEAANEQP